MKREDIGFLDFLSAFVIDVLEVDENVYFDVIEKKCTYHEGKFIIYACLSDREDKIQKAKELFESKLKD
jgi:hypothetical protein